MIASPDDKWEGLTYKRPMQEFWDLSRTTGTAKLPVSVLSNLLDVSAQTMSQPILEAINQISGVDYISLVEHPPSGQKPTQVAYAAKERQPHRDVTRECFERYRNLYFKQDPVTHLLDQMHTRDKKCEGVAALHVMREDIPDNAWKRDIYERENLPDRLSFLFAPSPECRLAVNLYRSAQRGHFRPCELETLLPMGSLIAQVFKSRLVSPKVFGAAATSEQFEVALLARAPLLSARERAVCARIATGMSVDGIAVDLGVAPSTVMTLRKRAYAKLQAQGGPSDRLRLVRWLTVN